MHLKTVLLSVLVFGITACGNLFEQPQDSSQDIGEFSTVTVPGSGIDLNALAVSLANACGPGQGVTWAYGPATSAGYNAAVDGSVTAGGLFTAPSCGSSLLGTTVSIAGSCTNSAGTLFTGTVSVKIKEEQVSGQTIGFAAVSACGAATCSATDPTKIVANACSAGSFTVQLYTRVQYTCGPVWAPSEPPSNLVACSVDISPGTGVTPSTCTSFTYSSWSTCASNGTQTRTVLTSAPAGCTGGSPVLTQTCTYTAPACTTLVYSTWGACQPNNTQTRTVTSALPAGCDQSAAVLTQACTYTAPTCTSFTYSAWGSCGLNGQQTRTVATSSPTGCTGGSPVLTQACTPTCNTCHRAPPTTGQHTFHTSAGYTCATCHGTGYALTGITATTHMNGTVNVAVTNWNATTHTCGGCHSAGSKTW